MRRQAARAKNIQDGLKKVGQWAAMRRMIDSNSRLSG